MKYIILVFSALVCAMSAWGIVQPGKLIKLVVNTWSKPWGLPFAVGVRLLLGAACLLAADITRAPLLYSAFGYLALAAAIAIPVLGKARIDRVILYWQDRPAAVMRAWLAVGLAFGLFLGYGVL